MKKTLTAEEQYEVSRGSKVFLTSGALAILSGRAEREAMDEFLGKSYNDEAARAAHAMHAAMGRLRKLVEAEAKKAT